MTDLIPILTQFGAAGLIGCMWIVERRQSAARDRQISEAHGQLAAQREALDAILGVVRDNTRAMVRLEHTQRRLSEIVQRLAKPQQPGANPPTERRIPGV